MNMKTFWLAFVTRELPHCKGQESVSDLYENVEFFLNDVNVCYCLCHLDDVVVPEQRGKKKLWNVCTVETTDTAFNKCFSTGLLQKCAASSSVKLSTRVWSKRPVHSFLCHFMWRIEHERMSSFFGEKSQLTLLYRNTLLMVIVAERMDYIQIAVIFNNYDMIIILLLNNYLQWLLAW